MLSRALARFPSRLPSQPYIVLPLRTYATPGRPKSVVGEPSRPVKRAVKKAARQPRDGSSPAKKNVASKRRSAVRRTKTPEQKAREEEREAAQKERLAKQKAANKVRADKLKAFTKARKEKDNIALMKKAALDAPNQKAYRSAWSLFVAQRSSSKDFPKGSRDLVRSKMGELAKANGKEWQNLSPADREHYNHIVRTADEKQAAEYKRWIESHSPAEIQAANQARIKLRRKLPLLKRQFPKLVDERQPKRASNRFALFAANRQHSGDFKGIKVSERSKLIGQEWNALSESEKQKYAKLAEEDRERYVQDYTRIFGKSPTTRAKAKKASPAAVPARGDQ